MKNNSLFVTTYLIRPSPLTTSNTGSHIISNIQKGDDTMVLEIQVEIQNSLTSNLFMMKRDYCINTDQRQCMSCKFIRNF